MALWKLYDHSFCHLFITVKSIEANTKIIYYNLKYSAIRISDYKENSCKKYVLYLFACPPSSAALVGAGKKGTQKRPPQSIYSLIAGRSFTQLQYFGSINFSNSTFNAESF